MIWARFPFQKRQGPNQSPVILCLSWLPPHWPFPVPLHYHGQSWGQGLPRSATGSAGISTLCWLCEWRGSGYFPLFTEVVGEANVSVLKPGSEMALPHVQRTTVLYTGKTWGLSHTQSCPHFLERGHALPGLPSESEQLAQWTSPGVSWALPRPSASSADILTLEGTFCHRCCYCWWSSHLGTDGWAPAVRAQRAGYTS